MSKTIHELKENLSRRISESRVTSELHGLSGRFFAGSLLKFILRVLLDFAILASILYFSDQFLSTYISKIEYHFLLRIIILGAIIFIGSLISTRFMKEGELVHSTCLTSILGVCFAVWCYNHNLDFITSAAITFLVLLLMFCGYRFGLNE